jgi:hypothetical protein
MSSDGGEVVPFILQVIFYFTLILYLNARKKCHPILKLMYFCHYISLTVVPHIFEQFLLRLVLGMNSLLLYIGHIITNNALPWKWQPLSSSHAELLAMDAWATALWIFISYQLYRNNIFFTV